MVSVSLGIGIIIKVSILVSVSKKSIRYTALVSNGDFPRQFWTPCYNKQAIEALHQTGSYIPGASHYQQSGLKHELMNESLPPLLVYYTTVGHGLC